MAKKKDETNRAGLQRLKADLKESTIAPLYIFYGEETYLRDNYLGELKAKLIPPGMEGFNYHLLSGKSITARQLAETVDALPMMCERTMVVVMDYDIFKVPEAERKLLAQLFEDLPDYCCLVFVYDVIEYKPDARMKKLAGPIRTVGREVEFYRQEPNLLQNWIARRFRALGKEITRSDAEYLIFLCGDLMTGLISEIEKIAAYAKDSRVTRKDIDTVAIPRIDAVVFEMTGALTRGQYDKALSVMNDLFRLKETPTGLLGMLGRQMRQLYSARVALDGKKSIPWLQELWGMGKYAAEELMYSARRYDLDWYKWALARCAETDLAMKSAPGVDGKDLLVSLVLELAAGVKP